jgi:cbb3-type cytochrome oxidase subunit 1
MMLVIQGGNLSRNLLRCATVYALLGIGLGIVMAIQHDFVNRGVHVHANLVGWVSMAVMALAYRIFPRLTQSKLATAQFWAHNLGLPIMLLGIYGVLHGLAFGEPCAGIGSLTVALAFVSFAINVWRNVE